MEFSSCLSELFQSSQEGIVLLQPEGTILWYNDALATFLSLPVADQAGECLWPFLQQLQWDGQGSDDPCWQRLGEAGGSRQQICCLPPTAGETGSTLLCLAQRLDSGPLAGNLLLRFTDLTLMRQSEERGRALRRSEERLRRLSQEYHVLLDGIPDSILYIGASKNILWGNLAATSRFALESELAGRFCYDALFDRSEACGTCPLEKSLASGRPESIRIVAKGRHLESRVFPIPKDNGEIDGFLLLQRDLTDQVRMQEKALQTANLASLGELAAGVAHEINNPVTGIINCGQLLFDRLESESPDRGVAQRIIREGERISVIVRSLLSLAHGGQEKKEGVRIEEELLDLLSLTRAQMRKERIIVTVRIASGLPAAVANPQQIRQVFLNIINNARYALNEKYPGFSDEKILEIRGERCAGEPPGVRFSFLDYGTGIPEAVQDRIFHPFFTTKPVGRGTGLGLSISHSIIADHEGKLLIESKEGDFTRVVIELPGRGGK